MWPCAAAQRPLRRNLHERCARAGTEPAATLRSSIRARPPATAKASARACASFQRRNGEGMKLAPHSESSGEKSRGERQPRLADSTGYHQSGIFEGMQELVLVAQQPVRRSSFIAQGYHGIDLGGAARGDVARQQRGQQQNSGDGADSSGIHRIDVIQDGPHQAADKVRAG